MTITTESKDYTSTTQAEIVSHLGAVFQLLKLDISNYCEVEIGVTINGGKINDRIDTTIHHIHKKRGISPGE